MVPYADATVSCLEANAGASDMRRSKLKYSKIVTNKDNAALDKTKHIYNDQLTISNTPQAV